MPSKGPPACLGWVSPLPWVIHTLGRASCPLGDHGTELQLFHTDLQVNRVSSGSGPFSAGSRKWGGGGSKRPLPAGLGGKDLGPQILSPWPGLLGQCPNQEDRILKGLVLILWGKHSSDGPCCHLKQGCCNACLNC